MIYRKKKYINQIEIRISLLTHLLKWTLVFAFLNLFLWILPWLKYNYFKNMLLIMEVNGYFIPIWMIIKIIIYLTHLITLIWQSIVYGRGISSGISVKFYSKCTTVLCNCVIQCITKPRNEMVFTLLSLCCPVADWAMFISGSNWNPSSF